MAAATATNNGSAMNNDAADNNEQQPPKPSDIEADIKDMERRKRVEMIMNSQLFREELERIINGQLINENGPIAGLSALHQVTELLQRGGFTSSTLRSSSAIVPINDLRGIDSCKHDIPEKLLRCKVAAVYRLIDLHGWSQNIYNHISARINKEKEEFLINPFGLQYSEITASSLVKIDIQGNLIDQGSTNFLFNRAGFNLHSAIHRARPDLLAIIHIHHAPVVAVSTFKQGLLPISQEAAILGDVSYYDYTGILVDNDEQDAIAQALGIHNKVMILKNHGVVACGANIEEAFFYLYNVVKACEVQVKLLPVGIENLNLMSQQAIDRTRDAVKHSCVVGKDGDGLAEQQKSGTKPKKMNVLELDFEANMRMLDNLGYRTGYVYKYPLTRREERLKYDVEEPPTVTSVQSNYFDQEKWLSPLKKLVDGKKTHDRIAWVNSPNVYQKKEILEKGTHDPRVITRWIQDGKTENGQHYNHTKIDIAHQFAPHSLDVDEFKRKQKAMKELRLRNTISSGPQSQILDGVTWDELKQGGESQEAQKSQAQTIIVGAASKGIIQRDHQHDAKVYKAAYAKNPFDNISEAELEEYKRLVGRKQRGEDVPEDEIPENMRHLLAEPMMDLIASPTSPNSPLSEDESEKDRKKKDKKKRIRTPSFLRGGKASRDKEEEKVEKKEEKKEEKRSEEKREEKKKEKEKKKERREKERAQ